MESASARLTDWQLNELLSTGVRDDGLVRRAVTEIFHSYRGPLYRYLFGILRDPAETEDATQEVFLRLYTELCSGSQIRSGRAWLFQTGHNLAVDRCRRSGREEFLNDKGWALLEEERPESDGHQGIVDAERRRALVEAMSELTDQERRAMELRAEGLRYREIAEVLGIRIPSVQSYLSRAVKKLVERIDV